MCAVRRITSGACLWALMALPAVGQPADDAPKEQTVNPLVAKQEMIRDRIARLEDRMFRLRDELLDSEPENAARLAEALERSGELAVEDRVSALIDILRDGNRLGDAVEVQGALLDDLQLLLKTLTIKQGDEKEREREIARLEEIRARVDELAQRQRALRNDTADQTRRQRGSARLGEAIRRLDDIIQRQESLIEGTHEADTDGARENLEQEQGRLQRDTERLAEDVESLAPDSESGEGEGQGGDPSAGQQGEQNGQSQGDQSGQPGGQQGGEPSRTEAASEDLRSAQQRMGEAQSQLHQDKSESAQTEQEAAVEDLKRARHRLQEEMEELQRAEQDQELADGQKDLSKRAQSLLNEMQGGSQSGQQGGQQGQQQGGQQQGGQQEGGRQPDQQTPGQRQLQQAQGHMDDAAEDLDDQDPREATRDQDAALEQLEDALAELEEALRQLRQEEQEEILRDLQSRFREMLAKQLEINGGTVELHEIGPESFTRADRLQAAELSSDEDELAGDASKALHILEEEGTTVVFPAVLEQLSGDMRVVAQRLADLRVGVFTQTLEEEIAETLENLVDAIERELDEMQQQQNMPMQAGSPADQPLLPTSAELKLLRSMQVRVFKRTTVIDEERAEGALEGEELQKVTHAAEQRQREAADIATEMRDLEDGR